MRAILDGRQDSAAAKEEDAKRRPSSCCQNVRWLYFFFDGAILHIIPVGSIEGRLDFFLPLVWRPAPRHVSPPPQRGTIRAVLERIALDNNADAGVSRGTPVHLYHPWIYRVDANPAAQGRETVCAPKALRRQVHHPLWVYVCRVPRRLRVLGMRGNAPQMRLRVAISVSPAVRCVATGGGRIDRVIPRNISPSFISALRRLKAQQGGKHWAARVPAAATHHPLVQYDWARRQARASVADRARVDHHRGGVRLCEHGAFLFGGHLLDGKAISGGGRCCRKYCALLWGEGAVQGHGGRRGGGAEEKETQQREEERGRGEKRYSAWCRTVGYDQVFVARLCNGCSASGKGGTRGRGVCGD